MEIAIILIGAMLLDALIVIGPTIVLSLVGFPRLSLFAALAVVMLLFVDQSVNFEHLSYPKTGMGRLLSLPNDLFLLSIRFGAVALVIGLKATFPGDNRE